MPKSSLSVSLKGADDIFSTEESRQEQQREQVQQIPIGELHPFTNHPFKVVDDEAMTRTVESIAQFGVLAPLIARPRPDGDGYEIISGHRRQFAAKMAGLETLPVIVRNMDDDAATILMVDSNLQREHISPSERAFAYKMKMDAMKRTAGRPSKENSRQVVGNFETADLIGKESGESGRQVQRFIRLTNLIPELLNMVDEKKVSFNPAVELSYLSTEQQQEMINAIAVRESSGLVCRWRAASVSKNFVRRTEIGEIPDFCKDHSSGVYSHAGNRENWWIELIYDFLNRIFDFVDLGGKFLNEFNGMLQFQRFGRHDRANRSSGCLSNLDGFLFSVASFGRCCKKVCQLGKMDF